MKALLIATSLMFGTAAMAQDMGAQTPPANQPMQGPNATSPAPDTTMPATTDAPMAAPSGNSAPMTGAPAAGAPMSSSAAPMASDPSSYPPCSRTVTDKCVSGGKKMTSKTTRHHSMKKKSSM